MFKTCIFRLLSVHTLNRCILLRSHGISEVDSFIFTRFVQNSSVMAGPVDKFDKKSPKQNGASSDSVSEESDNDVVCTTTTVRQSGPKLDGQEQQGRRITREAIAKIERGKYLMLSKEEKRKLYKCKERYVELEGVLTWPDYFKKNKEKKRSPVTKHPPQYKVNEKLNNKVSVWRGDITTLEIDAIVNAANNSLLGGGGVDGAIHHAAGSELIQECSTLGGCDTGDAKISRGYNLPAKYVIHTVGPIGEKEKALRSAYNKCLKLVRQYKIRSVAFPCISTGIYGYPNHKATLVAIETVRKFLEEDGVAEAIDRVIFCLFMPTDVKLYDECMPIFFPLRDGDLKSTVKKPRKSDEEEENLATTKKDNEDSSKTKTESASPNKNPAKRSPVKGDNSDKSVSPEAVDKDSCEDDEEVKVLENH